MHCIVKMPKANTCNICCEKFNKTTKKLTVCLYCNHESCRSCQKQYMLQSLEEPQCMQCHNEFTQDQLDDIFNKSFRLNEWTTHRIHALFEKEKSLLPATQPHVEYIIAKESIDDQIKNFNREKRLIDSKIMELHMESSNLKIKELNSTVNIPCSKESCRGFVNTALLHAKHVICSICSTQLCLSCYETIHDYKTHICDPDTLSTISDIKSNTKPCPKCAIPTSKIDGCNQMWCTQCHTTWSWTTGKIESRILRIHNPHYYEYQRRQGTLQREIGDVLCGGMPTLFELEDYLIKCQVLQTDATIITNIHQAVTFYESVYIPMYATNPYTQETYKNLRIDYMRNKIDETAFKKRLQYMEKSRNKKQNISQIMQTFLAVSNEIFISLKDCTSSKEIMEKMNEIEQIRIYTNEQMKITSVKYNCHVPILNDFYNITRE